MRMLVPFAVGAIVALAAPVAAYAQTAPTAGLSLADGKIAAGGSERLVYTTASLPGGSPFTSRSGRLPPAGDGRPSSELAGSAA
jgi:hypothetical protein